MGPEQTYDENYQGEPADAGAPVRPAIHTTHHDDDRPAQVRIAELFERMQAHRPILQAVMQRCLERPCAFVELRQMIEGLSEHHRSVYAPEGFCDLLERSGALRKVTAEGEPFPEEDPEPRVVVEDGVLIGANAVVIEGVHIGKNAVVAAGSVVLEDVPDEMVVAGVPARIIKKKDAGATQKTALEEALRTL